MAVVTAAGQGTRLGSEGPKALVPVAGLAMVARAVRTLAQYQNLVAGVVTAPAGYIGEFSAVLAELDLPQPWQVVPGGQQRQESVYRGLQALQIYQPTSEYLCLIHDAARCLTPLSVVDRVVQALQAGVEAVTPAIPVVDTIREIIPENPTEIEKELDNSAISALPPGSDRAGNTLNRDLLRAVQTPQGFPWEKIWQAHCHFHNQESAWDDAMMVSALGGKQYFVLGDWLSFKITTKPDLELANLLSQAEIADKNS